MTAPKISGRSLVTLLVLHALWAQCSSAAEPGKAQFKDEVSKQTAIYQTGETERPEGYVIDRSLLSYVLALGSSFKQSLAALGNVDRWLDIGAGEGRAILDYVASKYEAVLPPGPARSGEKAKVVAISIEDRRTAQWHEAVANQEPKQITYLYGKRLRDYSFDELGKFQVITDVMGGFSYVQNLSLFMEQTLGLLTVNGNFHTVLQDVRAEHDVNKPHYPNASFLTEIRKADGSDLKICSWLKSITCAEVTCELESGWRPAIERYHIRKTCNEVKVPPVELTHFEAGTPPERKFLLNPSPPMATH